MPLSRKQVESLIVDHVRRFGISDGPDFASESEDARIMREDAVTTWTEALNDAGATMAEAAKACRRTARIPQDRWWRLQLPAVLIALEEERGANLAQGQAADPHGYSDRETAAAASRTCEHCQGGGLATVYHRDYAGDPTLHVVNSDGSTSRIKGRFAMACLCPLGRWILAANHRSASSTKLDHAEAERMRAQARAMDGIHAVIEGRTDYTIHDPATPPLDDHEVPRTLDWRAHLASWADRAAVPAARAGRFAPR